MLTGLGAGVLITLLFTLPPLLDIRGVRPILILRRAVEDNDDPFVTAAWRKITRNLAQVAAAILILAGLAAIATTLPLEAMAALALTAAALLWGQPSDTP